LPLRVGAHVPGGLANIASNALSIGAEALQTFATNPRAWATPPVDPALAERIRTSIAQASLGPLFLHAPYLVNIASSDARFLERSIANLAGTFQRGVALGADGVIIHAGHAGESSRDEGLRRSRGILSPLLDRDDLPLVIVELTAGGTGTIASRWPQAAELADTLDRHPRLRFCPDTCHAFSEGYDLSTPDGMTAFLDEMEREVGFDRVALIHANDSRDPLGARRDRHEHIGKGTIGLEGFRTLVRHPIAGRVPILVETRPDGIAEDIATLRSLAGA
jgi:deoxyribonuclease IV